MSVTKFLYVNTVSDKVVRYSVVYLSVRKWLVGDAPLNVNVALSEPSISEAAVHISAFTKLDD